MPTFEEKVEPNRNMRAVSAARLLRDIQTQRRLTGRLAVTLDGTNYRSLIAAMYALCNDQCSLVPLSPVQGKADVDHILSDSGARLIDLDKDIYQHINSATTLSSTPTIPVALAGPGNDREKLIIYTSGTTGKPKGVVHTSKSLLAQIETLRSAWRWTAKDRILHSLPLNHIHGLVNAFLCPLTAGASVEFQQPFDPLLTWSRWYYGNIKRYGGSAVGDMSKWLPPSGDNAPITVYMAVPTMYVKLYECYRSMPTHVRRNLSQSLIHSSMRLQVSGSAPLPTSLFEAWYRDVWQSDPRGALLERYGMTEIGMALSNPMDGPRVPGTVGRPLPGVQCRLDAQSSELQVRSPMLFSRYLSNPEATRQSFTSDGFFCTGDIAVTEPVTGNDGCAIDYYRLLGRQSVDIIKTGGYKVSAIEIEQTILNHPEVREVCVVGLPNETYGQIICAVIVPKTKGKLIPEGVQRWLRETAQLSSYKLPRQIIIRNEIPRNQLGKINKRNIARELS